MLFSLRRIDKKRKPGKMFRHGPFTEHLSLTVEYSINFYPRKTEHKTNIRLGFLFHESHVKKRALSH